MADKPTKIDISQMSSLEIATIISELQLDGYEFLSIYPIYDEIARFNGSLFVVNGKEKYVYLEK